MYDDRLADVILAVKLLHGIMLQHALMFIRRYKFYDVKPNTKTKNSCNVRCTLHSILCSYKLIIFLGCIGSYDGCM